MNIEIQYSPSLGYFIPDEIDCKYIAKRYHLGLPFGEVNQTICDLMLSGF